MSRTRRKSSIPERPQGSRALRILRRTAGSTGVILTLLIVAAVVAVANVDFGKGGKPPSGAAADVSTNELARSLGGYTMDPMMAQAQATARERAYQAQLAAERDAKKRAAAEAKRREWEAFKKKMSHDPSAADNQKYAKKMNALKGWGRCWPSLLTMWNHESGWNEHAENPGSGAYGIAQALPGSKMASVASDWHTNAITQITWGLSYIGSRYGDPCRAWGWWQAHRWY
ncbi:lytic transglycosylase domain-containing protein [Actinoallomurus purpureus]|uniref:aggregation-promoting factor C-terminal-like domain-containing protein n=1 Tax=Actinoallomurus purpureus TaxID=478114 RepID=UPI002092D847|nr:lytic transglycosylase domain-containing protein [Actinoallomurus purpureus]MCO6005167.1 lytic transglycosylase domain-containing protein [Actinoallomurus purpureus]